MNQEHSLPNDIMDAVKMQIKDDTKALLKEQKYLAHAMIFKCQKQCFGNPATNFVKEEG